MLAEKAVKELQIKCQGTEEEIGNLSGGNQQKAVFARSLISEPKVLLLDDPTVGVDIESKLSIAQTVRNLADGGKAVLLVSGEFDEMAKIADRVLVLIRGRIVGEIRRGEGEISEASLTEAVYQKEA